MSRYGAIARRHRGRNVSAVAHLGAGSLLLALSACGLVGSPTDQGAESGGASSGSASSGAAANDGDATGGSEAGGSGTGGLTGDGGTGGAASGGAGAGGQNLGGAGSNACPGETVPEGYPTCRSNNDCSVPQYCVADPLAGCGTCLPAQNLCASDGDCTGGAVCAPGPDLSCLCDGRGTLCVAACTENSCAQGEVCQEDGHCVPASCTQTYMCPAGTVCSSLIAGDEHGCAPMQCDTDDYTCPDGMVCDPEVGSDEHGCRPLTCTESGECPLNHDCDPGSAGTGCVRRPCNGDGNCDCGACVFGTCQDHLYVCATPPA